jgi:predicted nucleic acid-binding protein
LILVDAGPLVALFDPADAAHRRCVQVLESVSEPLATTTPVLTEAFHLLAPSSIGAQRLMDFVVAGGMSVRFLDDETLIRSFELMLQYADARMDFADASLVVTAERESIRKVFTVDRRDFATYRIRRGHRLHALEIIG